MIRVALSITREFAPLIGGILMAGRELLLFGTYGEERAAGGGVADGASAMAQALSSVLERFVAELAVGGG